jgi:predicted  nucleic acid-binding Zn-ribbon protein
MKKEIFTVLLLLAVMTVVQAQKPLTIEPGSEKFGNTDCPGIWIDIPETNLETIRSNWVKAIEKGTKSNALKTGDEVTLFGALIGDIYDGPINVFSKLIVQDSLVKLFVSVEITRDVFTAPNSKENENMKAFARSFAKDQYQKVAEDQLSKEENKLKDLEKQLVSLRKDKERYEKEIQNANTTISEENYKIGSVKKEMAVTESTLDSKSTELSRMDDGDQKKATQSEVKELQKKKKSNMKDISTSENKISKANTEITDNNNNIAANLKHQDEVSAQIADQKVVVRNYTEKLKNIKSY